MLKHVIKDNIVYIRPGKISEVTYVPEEAAGSTYVIIQEGITKVSFNHPSWLPIRQLILPATVKRVYGANNLCSLDNLYAYTTTEGLFELTKARPNCILNLTNFLSYKLVGNTLTIFAGPDLILPQIPEGSYSDIEHVVIKGKFKHIAPYAFKNMPSIQTVEIESPITDIGYAAFSCSYDLTSIKLPNSLQTIQDEAFEGCCSLTEIKLPNKLTLIGASAFSGCSDLIEVKIPTSVRRVKASAFADCTSLKAIEWSKKCSNIDDHVFSGCESLESFVGVVKRVSATAFNGCELLKKSGGIPIAY